MASFTMQESDANLESMIAQAFEKGIDDYNITTNNSITLDIPHLKFFPK